MTDVNTKNLRETFYKFFFTNYKTFVTDNLEFGKSIRTRKPHQNPYNIVLMRLGLITEQGKIIKKVWDINTNKLVDKEYGLGLTITDISDDKLANSVDCFFDICSTESAKKHICRLLSFIVDGGSEIDEKAILVEDELLCLILNFFWKKFENSKEYEQVDKKFDVKIEEDGIKCKISREDFMQKVESRKIRYNNILLTTEKLLKINPTNSSCKNIGYFLYCVKELRNRAAHSVSGKNKLDYYDSTIINLFTLYTLLTTVLYLQILLGEDEHFIDLHVHCEEKEVKLLEDSNDVTQNGCKETGGWKYPIKRYHNYRISIPGKCEKEFEPKWFSQSPTVFCKEEWLYVDNEFEMDCILKNATYATIQEMNANNHNLLSEINTTLIKVDDTVSEINLKLESIEGSSEKLKSIDEKMTKAVIALEELVKNMQKSIEGSIKGDTEWADVSVKIDNLSNEPKKIYENLRNNLNTISSDVKGNRKWIKFFGFSILALLLLGLISIGYYLLFGQKKSAEEFVADGNSFLITGDTVAANNAYRNAIDAFNKRLSNNAEERMKLARHYMDIGNTEIAYRLILPLISDVNRYPDAVLKAAEIMFEKKDYHGVKTMINAYRSVINDSIPAINRLEGLLYIKGTEAGYPKDNEKGGNLIAKAAEAGDMQANYWMGCFLTEDMNDWAPLPDRDQKYVINMTSIDIVTGVDCLRKAAPTVLKATLKLGQVYANLNMVDSAEYYFKKVIESSEEGMYIYNQAKFGMGLLSEKKGEKDNTHLLVTKYKDAMLHDALSKDNPEAIIEIFTMVDYAGHRYLNPKALAYLALGKKEEALQTLVSQHKDGGFTIEFVDGLEKLLGTKYAYQDSLKGMQLMKQAANAGCDYAKMLCLYRDIEHRLLDKSQIEIMDVIALEKLGEKIPFAYVLASLMYSEANLVDRAQWAALKAMSSHHPAGALAITATYSKYTPFFFERLWKNEGECAKFYNTIQAALMKSPYKEKCIELSFFTDKARYDLHKNTYPLWRLAFWTDVSIANHFTYFEYFLLNAWNQFDKSWPEVRGNKKKLSCAILNNLVLSKADDQRLESLRSALNDMTVSEIDSLKQQFKGKIDALTVIDSRMHYKPQITYRGFNSIIKLNLPIKTDGIIFEFSGVIEKDKFSKYFKTINSQK